MQGLFEARMDGQNLHGDNTLHVINCARSASGRLLGKNACEVCQQKEY